MAFIYEDDKVISFAEYQDVYGRDRKLFDSNEGLTDDVVEELLICASERILSKIRSTTWWRSYYTSRSQTGAFNTVADVPELEAEKILSRQQDFTDLTVYFGLADYILPLVANFGDEEDDERAKMMYYSQRAEALFMEIVSAGDWYDFDGDGTIQSNEKQPQAVNLRRVR